MHEADKRPKITFQNGSVQVMSCCFYDVNQRKTSTTFRGISFFTVFKIKSKVLNFICIRMEITVLYFKLFRRKSWILLSQISATRCQVNSICHVSPGKLNLRQLNPGFTSEKLKIQYSYRLIVLVPLSLKSWTDPCKICEISKESHFYLKWSTWTYRNVSNFEKNIYIFFFKA